MSRRGWHWLRDTYGEAWQVREATGDASPELLIETFGKAPPPKGGSAELMPGPFVLDLWNDGVEPRHLKRALYKSLGRGIWRATVVPTKAIYDGFRDDPRH